MNRKANDQAREAWNTNAWFWDGRMAEGLAVLLGNSFLERFIRGRYWD